MIEKLFQRATKLFARLPLWTLLKIGLALGLMWLILSKLTLDSLEAMWRRMELLWLAPCAIFFFAFLWALARRYWILIGRQIPFSTFLGIVTLQNALANLVSSAVGTISYLALLRAQHQVQLKQSVGSTLLARWGDLAIFLPLLILTSGLLWTRLGAMQTIVIVVSAALGGMVLVFPLAILFRQPFARALVWLVQPLTRFPQTERLVAQGRAFAEMEARALWKLLGVTFAQSIAVAAFSNLFALGFTRLFALPLSFSEIIFINIIVLLISYIPIQIFGGLGIYEFSALYLYTLFGVPAAVAIPVVVGTRALLILLTASSLLYLPLGNLWMRTQLRAARAIKESETVTHGD